MLDFSKTRPYASHSDGLNWAGKLGAQGPETVIEDGVRVFHPRNVHLAGNCFIGHQTLIDGYHQGHVRIGEGTWIGAFCFLHGAGGIDVGRAVGIGPRVTMLTSQHQLEDTRLPVLHGSLDFAPITIGDGCDIGAASVILPGVDIKEGAVVGAGSVVTKDVPALAVVAGNPAQIIRIRD